MIAAHYHIPEVCIYFNGKLLRGNRSSKCSSSEIDAYISPNLSPLVKMGIDYKVNWKLIRSPPDENEPFCVNYDMCREVVILKIFPGINYEVVKNVLQPPTKGCVLETYGAGNAPSDPKFLNILKEASERGVIILNVTQCQTGHVVDGAYATGSSLCL